MREAIVLAGGLGTRLRSVLGSELPKVMAPVAGQPFLALLLRALEQRKFTRVVLALGFGAAAIRAHVGERHGALELAYSIEETPLGTGGAVRAALALCGADTVHVVNGDTWVEPELEELERMWMRHHECVIVAQQVEDTMRYGRLDVDGEQRVIAFGEKTRGGPGLINAGWYLIGRDALRAFAPGTAFSFETAFLAPAVQAGRVRACIARGRFVDIGVPEDLERARSRFASAAMAPGAAG